MGSQDTMGEARGVLIIFLRVCTSEYTLYCVSGHLPRPHPTAFHLRFNLAGSLATPLQCGHPLASGLLH